ncbi:MAG: hypothetical protein WCI74_19450, partial [Actinomycetes bacterium]
MSSEPSIEGETMARREPGSSEVSFVNTTLQVLALIWVGCGLISLLVFSALDPAQFTSAIPGLQVLVLVCIAGDLVIMVLALVLRLLGNVWVVVAMMATATVSILASEPMVDGQPFPLSVQWVTMAAFVTALLLRPPAAWKAIVGFSIAANSVIALRLVLTGQQSMLLDPVISTVDAIGISMAALAAVTVWRQIAQGRDTAELDAALAAANAEITRERC